MDGPSSSSTGRDGSAGGDLLVRPGRFQIIAGAMLMLMAGVCVGLWSRVSALERAAAAPVIEAQAMQLTDGEGRPRIVMSGGADGGPSFVSLRDAAGAARLTMVLEENGEASLTLLDADLREHVTSRVSADGASVLEVSDNAGRDRWRLQIDASGAAYLSRFDLQEGVLMEPVIIPPDGG